MNEFMPAEPTLVQGPQLTIDSLTIEPPGRKVSPWFPGIERPPRPGVWERAPGYGTLPAPTERNHAFAYWDGTRWYRSASTPDEAHSLYEFRVPTRVQCEPGETLPWRGLLNEFMAL